MARLSISIRTDTIVVSLRNRSNVPIEFIRLTLCEIQEPIDQSEIKFQIEELLSDFERQDDRVKQFTKDLRTLTREFSTDAITFLIETIKFKLR